MAIDAPRKPDDYPERFLECEQALEAAVQALIWEAVKAGWDEGEACAAVASLADHHVLAMQANACAERSMRGLKQ
jgi:hypothetical protein